MATVSHEGACSECARQRQRVQLHIDIDAGIRLGRLKPFEVDKRKLSRGLKKPLPHRGTCTHPNTYHFPIASWKDGEVFYIARQIIERRLLLAQDYNKQLSPCIFNPIVDTFGKHADPVLTAALANSELVLPSTTPYENEPHVPCDICCFRGVADAIELRPYTITEDANMLDSLQVITKHRYLVLRHVYNIPGSFGTGKYTISAVPDTGAEENIISLDYAKRCRVTIDGSGPGKMFTLPNGRRVSSAGRVTTSWRFDEESDTPLFTTFEVLNGCPRDIVFGNCFLRKTETMTAHRSRLRKQLVLEADMGSFFAIGTSHQRVAGHLNNVAVTALPDTGCVVNLITLNYALSNGLEISMKEKHIGALQYADGSTEETVGRVTTTWAFQDDPENPITLCFEVLLNCRYNIVLGQEALLSSDALNKHSGSFVEETIRGRDVELSPVVSKPVALQQLEAFVKNKDTISAKDIPLATLTPSGISEATWKQMEEVEIQERIRKDREIDSIADEETRTAVKTAEDRRREKWQEFRDRVDAHMHPPSAPKTSQSSLSGGFSSEASSTLTGITVPEPVATRQGRRKRFWQLISGNS